MRKRMKKKQCNGSAEEVSVRLADVQEVVLAYTTVDWLPSPKTKGNVSGGPLPEI